MATAICAASPSHFLLLLLLALIVSLFLFFASDLLGSRPRANLLFSSRQMRFITPTANTSIENGAPIFEEILPSLDEVSGSVALKSTPEILLLTPLKQAAGHLDQYFHLIHSLSYPSQKISLGFLVSDSKDSTYDKVKAHFQPPRGITSLYRKVSLIRQDFQYDAGSSWGEIHSISAQLHRRAVLAKSRNFLLMSTIRPEHEWVLWIDSDVSSYPTTLIEDLISFTGPGRSIIAPNNFWKAGDGQEKPYDRNNWQDTEESRKFLKETSEEVIFEGYARYKTGRLILGDLRGIKESIVKLDGVGGTVLLVRAQLHREGLIFLPVPYKKTIETESLASLAIAMGYQPWGLPNYITFH